MQGSIATSRDFNAKLRKKPVVVSEIIHFIYF